MMLQKSEYQDLLSDLISLVENTKQNVVAYANSSVVLLFWHVGNKILTDTLQNKRADYGKQIVVTLSRELVERFGNNYEEKNLRRMIQFAEEYTDLEIVVTLSRQLSWSHFLALIPIKNEDARAFYGKMAADAVWGVRDLRKQISKKLYERTENVNLQLHNNVSLTKGIFKDPYLLDFLELKDGYLENDLESAILKELELFILELGSGFTFVERQKRMIIDGDDYNLDLLFFHRKLKRLILT